MEGECVVLVPVAGAVEPETEAALRVLNRDYPVRYLRGCSQIDLARSVLASDALADGFAETMWIDSDVVFDPADVGRLRARQKPFTAGLYVKKGSPEFAGKFRRGDPVTFGKGGGLVEMEYVGFGFTLVRRPVYEAMARVLKLPACTGGYEPGKAVTPYFLPTVIREGDRCCYLSEDSSFCHRARQVGYPPVADTTIKLGHGNGRYKYTWDDLAPRQVFESFRVEFDLEKGGG